MRLRLGSFVVATSLFVCSAAAAQEPAPPPEQSTLDPLRDRFRAGMDEYQAGKYGDAILIWLDIYRELGPEKGYRLAFNLGRAYDQTLNEQKALEFYEAFLAEVGKRHAASETLEPIVEKQEGEANERLAEPRAKFGRLRIADPTVQVRIDTALPREGGYVAYVPPGKHTVTFRPSTKDETHEDTTVAAGQIVDLAPPPVKPPEPTVVFQPTRYEMREQRPYPKIVPYIVGGATALSFIVPLALYIRAGNSYDAAHVPTDPRNQGQVLKNNLAANDYSGARDAAYASWAIPAVLGAATIVLTTYYFLGKKNVRTPVQTALAF